MLDPCALAFAHERNPVFLGFCDYFAVRFVQLLIESVETCLQLRFARKRLDRFGASEHCKPVRWMVRPCLTSRSLAESGSGRDCHTSDPSRHAADQKSIRR